MEDVLRSGLLILDVPDQSHAIWLMWRFLIVVVRCYKEFWMLEKVQYLEIKQGESTGMVGLWHSPRC